MTSSLVRWGFPWIGLLVVWSNGLAREPLAPWASNHHPTDVSRHHVEIIATARHAYAIQQGGTMDGTNCRSPIGVGMMDGPAAEQTWESNRSVRMENVGEADVVNPWLSNRRNNFRTLDEIVAAAVAANMSDKEKALALWFQEIRHRYHFDGDNQELGDPVKVFNIYGYNTCGNDSICLAGLWRKAGLKVAPARVVGHCVTQAFFDQRWHLLDGDMHAMYLLRDNETIAGEQDLVRDHDLIRRSHTQGILNPDRRANDEWESSIYVYEGKVVGERNCFGGTTMNMVLRPQEAITWRWGHVNPIKYHGGSQPKYPDTICNGLWEYRPDFSKDLWRKGADKVEGVMANGEELAAEADRTGTIIWTLRSPYVFVGGRLEVDGVGARFALSWDGRSWEDAGPDLNRFFPPAGPARYQYQLRCQLDRAAHLKHLAIVNDVQMAPLVLPGMTIGENRFVYTDRSSGKRKVRITHEWVERSASRPPAAPPAPLFPPQGGDIKGTDLAFRWMAPADSDGGKISDYHFELSDRPDMQWPLSTNFYKLISRTADCGKAQYTLPYVGLLAPDRAYYWRVRARNEKGVWGPWSKTWSFTSRGPTPPIDLTLDFDPQRGTGILRWKPNPRGRQPVKYRIYGSDEKGFSISDVPYQVNVGISKVVPSTFAANFVTETPATEIAVVGREITLANANRAFYRVVAVDAQGNRSGPSGFTAAPRPFIYSKPVARARVGAKYRYQVLALRSLGDLRTRLVGGKETLSFWDIESPRFNLLRAPAWLQIDEQTGLLSGTPETPTKAKVIVRATIKTEARMLDERQLSWGVEKVVSRTTQQVGSTTQEFVIEVEAR
jgi:hypothetical protein